MSIQIVSFMNNYSRVFTLKYAMNTRVVIFFHLDLRTTATSVIEMHVKFLGNRPAL